MTKQIKIAKCEAAFETFKELRNIRKNTTRISFRSAGAVRNPNR